MAKKKTLNRKNLIAILAILVCVWAIYDHFSSEETIEEAPEIKELTSPTYSEDTEEGNIPKYALLQSVDIFSLDYEPRLSQK